MRGHRAGTEGPEPLNKKKKKNAELPKLNQLHLDPTPIPNENISVSAHKTRTLATREDPDEMLHDAAFHAGLHCLQDKNKSS